MKIIAPANLISMSFMNCAYDLWALDCQAKANRNVNFFMGLFIYI